MSDLTREELDIKIELIETRMDARLAEIMATLRGLAERMEERLRHMDERWRAMTARMDQLDNRMTRLEQALTSLKTTMIITAISASLATVFGVAAFNATLHANMLNAYDAGQSNARIQAELSRQVQETGVLLRKIQERAKGQDEARSEKKVEASNK